MFILSPEGVYPGTWTKGTWYNDGMDRDWCIWETCIQEKDVVPKKYLGRLAQSDNICFLKSSS